MKRAITFITAAVLSTPVMAWGDREQGALLGIAGTLLYQHIQRDSVVRTNPNPVYVPSPVVVQQPPVVIQQPIVVPQPQIILQNTGIVCPQGQAAFFNQRIDRYGRNYYIFDGCR